MAKHKSVKTVSCFLLLSSNFGLTAGLHLKNVVHNFYEILDVTHSPMEFVELILCESTGFICNIILLKYFKYQEEKYNTQKIVFLPPYCSYIDAYFLFHTISIPYTFT